MKETLTREEILERSKRENRNGDERERTVRVQGESFSLIFVFLMGLALIAWKRFHSLPDEDVLVMFWTSWRGQPHLPADPAAECLRHRDAWNLPCLFGL